MEDIEPNCDVLQKRQRVNSKKQPNLNTSSEASKGDADIDSSEYEIIELKGEITYVKQTLTVAESITILFIVGVGSNVQLLFLPFQQNAVRTSMLMVFYALSGVLSCHFYIQCASITKISSILEIAALLEGRGAVFYTCLLVFLYYSVSICTDLLSFYMYLQLYLKIYFGLDSLAYVNLICILCSFAISPACLLKDIYQFRKYGLCLVVISFLIVTAAFGWIFFLEKDFSIDRQANFERIYQYTAEVCTAFQFQCFFLIIYSSIERTQRMRQGYRIAIVTAGVQLGYALYMCTMLFMVLGKSVDIKHVIIFFYELPQSFVNFSFFIELPFYLLTIPMKFLVAKEFLLIMVDELYYRGVSKKIQDLVDFYAQSNQVYSDQMVAKLRGNYYEVLRIPYLRWERKRILLFSLGLYSLNILVAQLILNYVQQNGRGNDIKPLEFFVKSVVVFTKLIQAFVQPVILYCIPGYFFYKCFDLMQIDEIYNIETLGIHFHRKYFGILFCGIGVVITIFCFATSCMLAMNEIILLLKI